MHRHTHTLFQTCEFMIESSHFERTSRRMTSPTHITSSGARHTLPVWRTRTHPRLCRNAEPPRPRTHGCSRLTDDNGAATPSDEMQCRCANGMVPNWARPFPSLGNCAGPQHVVGVDTMVATLQKAFFEEPSKRGVRLRGPQVRANRPSHGLTLLRTMAATQAGLSG